MSDDTRRSITWPGIPQWVKDFFGEIKARLMPFLMLLDSRYLPLILVESYQSFSVYLYLWNNSPKTNADFVFSVLGGAGFTAIYVGVIAWAERREYNGWVAVTAFTALVFGVSVAIVNFWPTQGVLAILHAGFPLTGFAYTLAMHGAPAPRNPVNAVLGWLNSRSAAVKAAEAKLNEALQQVNEAREIARKVWQERGAMASLLEQTKAALEQRTTEMNAWRRRFEDHKPLVAQAQNMAKQAIDENEQLRADIERLEKPSDIDKPAIARGLKKGEMTVADIAALLNVSTGSVSKWTRQVNASSNGHAVEV